MKKKSKKWWILLSIVIIIVHFLPFYILATTSLKAPDDPSSKWMFPGYLYLDNFVNAWYEANLNKAFLNNVINTAISLVVLVFMGSLASYPLARFKTSFNKFIYFLFISMLIVPPLTILVPLYKLYVDLNALNTHWGMVLILVTFYLPMTIFLYTGFIGSIPRELDEAALIDGSSYIGLFFRIILPLLKPVTATVIIINGVFIWNDYQFSLFFLQDPDSQTIPVALSQFFGTYSSQVGWVAAGSLLGALPITIVYLFLQKYFVQGIVSGSVKG